MENSTVDIQTITGINTCKVQFQFEGHYYGKPVTWQCNLQTLDHFYQELVDNNVLSGNTPVTLRRFFNITNTDSSTPDIHIVLDVAKIDEPTIRKSIIMVHNYKKLHEGIHEYGEAYKYPRK